jgi:glyoxylase-like metal-dependent hydrolase (beta-lactamase superfamily II)
MSMKLTFLGTAAAEGIPFPFCECATCRHARANKGRNIRKRQTLLVNGDLLIDVGPDLYASCAELGLSLAELRYLLVTHSHEDHFHAHNLMLRARMFRLETELPELTVIASPSAWAAWKASGGRDESASLRRVPFLPGHEAELGPYRIEAIEASHMPETGDAMNYIVGDGKKTLLFASDTGKYRDAVWERLAGRRFDAVVMEATLGHKQQGKRHLSFSDYRFMLDRMRAIGAVGPDTRLFATHFSHQCVEPHDKLEADFRSIGVVCAFDGLTAEV